MTDLERLKNIALSATQGPWEWIGDFAEDQIKLVTADATASEISIVSAYGLREGTFVTGPGCIEIELPNAEFIEATDPATVLALIAQIEAVTTLHKSRTTDGGLTVCDHCCSQYPCHTVKAIGDAA